MLTNVSYTNIPYQITNKVIVQSPSQMNFIQNYNVCVCQFVCWAVYVYLYFVCVCVICICLCAHLYVCGYRYCETHISAPIQGQVHGAPVHISIPHLCESLFQHKEKCRVTIIVVLVMNSYIFVIIINKNIFIPINNICINIVVHQGV